VLAGSTDTYSYVGTSETVARIANAVSGNLDSIVSPGGDRLGVKGGSTVNWLLPDLHGNLAASLSADESTVTWAIRYDPYGMTLATGLAGGTAVGAGTWKYQGRLDVSPAGLNTPLYDLSARFYAPGISAFTQLDSSMGTAQNPLSMNRFLYAEANPATLVDPTGHFVAEYDSGPTAAHDPNGSCQYRGDWGCGRTAATSRAKVNPAAKKPVVQPAHFIHRISRADDDRESAGHASAGHAYAVTPGL
jgi:RHS repeat-associated protein